MGETEILDLRLGAVQTRKGLRSAIFKASVPGPVWVGREGLVGDEVADRKHHGGPDQALLAYSAVGYDHWDQEGRAFERGTFGENLLLAGFSETEACVGDILEGPEVCFQISHPRVPCGTLARRLESEGSLQRVWETGRGGFYLRVLKEGWIQPGQILQRTSNPNPEWPVLRALHAQWKFHEKPEEGWALSKIPELSLPWRERLALGAPS